MPPLPPAAAEPPCTDDNNTKIARIQTFALVYRLPETLIWAQGRIANRRALLVRVETAGGAVGWGECAGPPAVAQAAIQYIYGPRLIGCDVRHPSNLWNEVWAGTQPWGRRGVMLGALSGLDIALWDLRGKLLGQPLCDLIGGMLRDRIPAYAVGLFFRDRPESELIPLLVDEAHEYVEAGYRAVQASLGRNLSFDGSLIRSLRRSLPSAHFFAHAGSAYDLSEAIHIGRILEENEFRWLSEPLSPERPGDLRLLADRVRISLSAGSAEQTRWGFQALLAPGGLTVIEPNPTYCGGISELLHIRSIANTFGVNVSPFTNGTQINFAAALHFMASDARHPGRLEPTVGVIGRNPAHNPLRDDIFSETIPFDGGVARVPNRPGLGVAVDEAAMRGFCENVQEVGKG